MRAITFVGAGAVILTSASAANAQRVVFPQVLSSPSAQPQSPNAGFGQRQAPVALLLAPTPTWSVSPKADSTATARQSCPMPVIDSDPGRTLHMPTVVADSSHVEQMPVVRPACVNPLNR